MQMNRIDKLFLDKPKGILSVYITAGYPDLHDTAGLIHALQKHGADMVEIGIPFSDPLADGPVIQQSSQKALANGMSLELLFRQIASIRRSVEIPLLLMGYLNPLLRMGMDRFLNLCRETGIDGVIIPDLPLHEFESLYLDHFHQYGIHHSLLITPQTSPERIRRIATLSSGFIYLVADASTTGAKLQISRHQEEYFRRIRQMELPLPLLIGFGISSHETFSIACRYASGAIIGSALIKILGEKGFNEEVIGSFIRAVRNGKA